MWKKILQNDITLLLLLTGAVIFLLKFVTPLLGPLLLSCIFLAGFGPSMGFVQRHFRIKRQYSAVLYLLIVLGILLALFWILSYWLVGNIPMWAKELKELQGNLTEWMEQLGMLCKRWFGIHPEYLEQILQEGLANAMQSLEEKMVPGVVDNSVRFAKVLACMGGFWITFFIAVILLAKDYDRAVNFLLDKEKCHVILNILCGVIRYIVTFLKSQLIILSLISLLCMVVLSLFHVSQGIAFGLLAGVLDALPFIGTGIVLVPLSLSGFLTGAYGKGAGCLVLYVACILLRELLEPKLLGKQMGVSPVLMLMSLYAGIQLFGVVGILKGPLGFVVIWQAFLSLKNEREKEGKKDPEKPESPRFS